VPTRGGALRKAQAAVAELDAAMKEAQDELSVAQEKLSAAESKASAAVSRQISDTERKMREALSDQIDDAQKNNKSSLEKAISDADKKFKEELERRIREVKDDVDARLRDATLRIREEHRDSLAGDEAKLSAEVEEKVAKLRKAAEEAEAPTAEREVHQAAKSKMSSIEERLLAARQRVATLGGKPLEDSVKLRARRNPSDSPARANDGRPTDRRDDKGRKRQVRDRRAERQDRAARPSRGARNGAADSGAPGDYDEESYSYSGSYSEE